MIRIGSILVLAFCLSACGHQEVESHAIENATVAAPSSSVSASSAVAPASATPAASAISAPVTNSDKK